MVTVYLGGVDTPIQHILVPQLLDISVCYCSDKGPLSSDGHRCWWILRGITIPLCCPAQNSRYFSTDSTCAAGITGPIPETLTPLPNSAAAGSVFPMEKNDYSKTDSASLISKFCRVLNAVCFLLGNSPASELCMPTFRNALSCLHRQVCMKNEFFIHTYLPTFLWRWNRQSVPKCQHIKFRRQGFTQKKAYNNWL